MMNKPKQKFDIGLIKQAIIHGNRIAVREQGRDYSYTELLSNSEQLAWRLLEDKNDINEARVAFLVPASFDYVVVQWAIWRAGGIAVPLSQTGTDRELAYVLDDCGVDLVVTSPENHERVANLCLANNIQVLCFQGSEGFESNTGRLPMVASKRGAMILYTSGTTSQPKGVVLTHEAIESQIEGLVSAWQWTKDDRIPLFLPLHHIHGIVNVLCCGLWSGALIEVFPRFELEKLVERIGANAYSLFMAVPTIYVKLIEYMSDVTEPNRIEFIEGFSKMRLNVSGSAALPASVHARWEELTGQTILERYGMTEIGMALSNPYVGQRRAGYVGCELPGVEIRLQADEGEIITQEGTPGEIQVRSRNLFKEYWNRPEATGESFVGDWFATGDIAVLEDGYYRIMGRRSMDIIKSGGYKISALEIETVLLDHADVQECAVVGLPDPEWGEVVAVAIVTRNRQAIGSDEFQSWCRERLSKYKVPRKIKFVDRLPRNAMGKVVKSQVADQFTAIEEQV